MDMHDNDLRSWARQREFRAVLAELDGRTDHELGVMGLERGDLARAAFAEAERRVAPPNSRAEHRSPAGRENLPVLGRYRR